MTFPIAFLQVGLHYVAKVDDENCIKKHSEYMTGDIKARLSHEISMKRAKALAKKFGLTFNDLILGIMSNALKKYFLLKGDNSSYVSICVPFTFNTIPERIEDY